MNRILILLIVVCLLAGCGGRPAPSPDLIATQVVVLRAAAATLTAEAPTATPAPPTPPALEQVPMPSSPPPAVPPAAPSPAVVPAPIVPLPTVEGDAELYTVVGVASEDLLNVRAGPGTAHPIVGAFPPHAMGLQVTGPGEQVDNAQWLPVRHGELAGWVNGSYLARQTGWVDGQVASRAAQAIMALRDRDMAALSTLVHPSKGVRFSPYTYVRVGPRDPGGEDLVFSAEQVRDAAGDDTVYLWGRFDGTGEPIFATFAEYYARFVYDADFAQPHVVGFDQEVGWSSMINNIAEAYPGAVTVEYHFEGFDPQYDGMDWRSLRLVFEQQDGTWYLVGIVHDEWTI